MNKVFLSGKLHDVKVPTSESAQKQNLLYLSLLVKKERKLKEGEYPHEFIGISCFGKVSEYVKNNNIKGKFIEIEGSISPYQDSKGNFTQNINVFKLAIAEVKQQEQGYKSKSVEMEGEGFSSSQREEKVKKFSKPAEDTTEDFDEIEF